MQTNHGWQGQPARSPSPLSPSTDTHHHYSSTTRPLTHPPAGVWCPAPPRQLPPVPACPACATAVSTGWARVAGGQGRVDETPASPSSSATPLQGQLGQPGSAGSADPQTTQLPTKISRFTALRPPVKNLIFGLFFPRARLPELTSRPGVLHSLQASQSASSALLLAGSAGRCGEPAVLPSSATGSCLAKRRSRASTRMAAAGSAATAAAGGASQRLPCAFLACTASRWIGRRCTPSLGAGTARCAGSGAERVHRKGTVGHVRGGLSSNHKTSTCPSKQAAATPTS